MVRIVELDLVVKQKLLFRDRFAQFQFQCQAGAERLLHARVEEAQRIAPGLLCLIHGDVGLFQQFI